MAELRVPLKSFSLAKNTDIGISLGIVGILMVMIIPMPTGILDLLLALNITLAVIILLVAIYVVKPLDFSVFPSLLLVTTLFRLSLNIASTRLILLNGQNGALAAGKIIKGFGSFVVGGNPTVGLVVFVILVIINFVVITKGSGRIAEVAARFTLDAMPGKQMSIDADLNAGLIDEGEARERRRQISKEAEFYGAMDGASKFVRGDAIAGILITLINIIGGLVIFWVEKRAFTPRVHTVEQMTWKDALKIGIAQAFALIPGTSRSGATIMGAMIFGLSRTAATEFSFFLAIPTMFAATFYDLYKHWGLLHAHDLAVFATGFVTAFISAFFAVRALLRYIAHHSFVVFAWYRIVFGILILAVG